MGTNTLNPSKRARQQAKKQFQALNGDHLDCLVCGQVTQVLQTKVSNSADPTEAYFMACGHWTI